MKVKEINFSDYDYKRVCVYDENQTYYPVGGEHVLLAQYGEKEAEDHISVDEYGWLVIYIKGAVREDM
ncbi:MAG: hypothetical protein E7603_07050 [Ruminococcaceae bacterium]|nr:hypothetical protein [Oscillospiraceae bacterium]